MFFVIDHAKSGTTWMMNILNSHHEIVCHGEACLTKMLHPHLEIALHRYSKTQKAGNMLAQLGYIESSKSQKLPAAK